MEGFNLKFDAEKMNTTLAEDFLKSQSSFKPLGLHCSEEYILDSYNNKLYYVKPGPSLRKSHKQDFKPEETKLKFLKLAMKLEENVELLCQLEYLIRKRPINYTKNFDWKLIIQNLYFYSSKTNFGNDTGSDDILIGDDSSLVLLGYITRNLMSNKPVTVDCTRQTAVVCWLFTKFCHDVGFESEVFWNLTKHNKEKPGDDLVIATDFEGGCCGVVTAKCDVDSAVDTCLEAPHKVTWSFKRILVQESILKRFLSALKAKTKISENGLYVYVDKTFVFEYIGRDETTAILIEAYRTVKELLSLVKTYRPFCLSLWCSDVSESNEIALNIDCNIIWINDYVYFDGPPQSSQSIYSIFDKPKEILKSKSLDKLKSEWVKINVIERAQKVLNVLRNVDANKADVLAKMKFDLDSFFSYEKNCICCGYNSVTESVCVFNENIEDYLFLIQGCMFKSNCEIASQLQEIGAPIELVDNASLPKVVPYYNTKTIWTNYGTMFAN